MTGRLRKITYKEDLGVEKIQREDLVYNKEPRTWQNNFTHQLSCILDQFCQRAPKRHKFISRTETSIRHCRVLINKVNLSVIIVVCVFTHHSHVLFGSAQFGFENNYSWRGTTVLDHNSVTQSFHQTRHEATNILATQYTYCTSTDIRWLMSNAIRLSKKRTSLSSSKFRLLCWEISNLRSCSCLRTKEREREDTKYNR